MLPCLCNIYLHFKACSMTDIWNSDRFFNLSSCVLPFLSLLPSSVKWSVYYNSQTQCNLLSSSSSTKWSSLLIIPDPEQEGSKRRYSTWQEKENEPQINSFWIAHYLRILWVIWIRLQEWAMNRRNIYQVISHLLGSLFFLEVDQLTFTSCFPC